MVDLKFNNAVETGVIPKDWKAANLADIYKKGSRQEPGNYRSISLTSVVCMAKEACALGQLLAMLNIW